MLLEDGVDEDVVMVLMKVRLYVVMVMFGVCVMGVLVLMVFK